MPKGTRPDSGSYLPKSYIDKHLAQFDELLGYDNGFFENADTMVRIDIIDPKKSNISIPNGNEVGANNNWLPGGYTSGGVPEGIVHNVPNNSSYIKVTFLDNALNELN